jgi:hypothetical protein
MYYNLYNIFIILYITLIQGRLFYYFSVTTIIIYLASCLQQILEQQDVILMCHGSFELHDYMANEETLVAIIIVLSPII